MPLKLILDDISVSHDVKFSYLEDEIVWYNLTPPDESLSLKQKIQYLQKETRLRFKTINNTYYSVANDSRFDKPLCGYLLDEAGRPVENASITTAGSSVTTSSGADGYFNLPKLLPTAIFIRHQSYLPLEIDARELYSADCPTIRMTSVSYNLEEVAAQRYLVTGISKTAEGSFKVKPQKFGLLPGLTEPDVLQTMQQIPGIYSADESISNLNIRGGTHDQNLFLWNGIRMFQTGHFFGMISGFNPAPAQTISIIKNGSSGFFGESVSAHVDISSRTPPTQESQHSVSVDMIGIEFYSYNKLSERSSLAVSGRRSFTDIFDSPTYRKYRERIFQNTVITNLGSSETSSVKSDEEFYFYDLTAQFRQQIGEKHNFTADFIGIRNSLDVAQRNQDETNNSSLSQQNFGANLMLESQWSKTFTTSGNGYASYYNLDAANERVGSSQILDQQNTVFSTGLQLKANKRFSDFFEFRTGYQFDETSATNADQINTPAFSRRIREVVRSHVVILEGAFSSEDAKTKVTGGIRTNYFEKFSLLTVEPRLQFSRKLSKSITLEILGERKSQTLSQIIDLQRDFLGIEKRRWTLANQRDIPVQKSSQLSLGFTFKQNKWLLSLDNFFKEVDGITTSSQGFQNQFESIRTSGRYRVLGTEFLIQKNFNKFYSWVSYSFNDNNYKFDALTPPQFPNNFEFLHSVSWAGIYEWKRLKIALGSKWHQGRPYTEPASDVVDGSDPVNPSIIYKSPNSSRLPDYFQLNFSASKEWTITEKVRFQASLAVLNILDKKNVINRFYRINGSDNSIESADTYSLGMTPNLNLKISF